MKRREFIKLLGGASAGWPLAAHAQQAPPVLGFLHEGLPTHSSLIAAFQLGLIATGIAQVRNVKIENRWAEGQYDQLPRLARELVEQRVWVIIAPYLVAARGSAPLLLGARLRPITHQRPFDW
jgi:putative tryptophan/tyrosine transport system substrate-binding protein